MAKNKKDAEPEAVASEPAVVEVPISVPTTMWTVFLACPTPMASNPMTLPAESADEAQAKFNEANGIRGSDHPYTVTQS